MFGLKAKIKQAQATLDELNNIIETKHINKKFTFYTY